MKGGSFDMDGLDVATVAAVASVVSLLGSKIIDYFSGMRAMERRLIERIDGVHEMLEADMIVAKNINPEYGRKLKKWYPHIYKRMMRLEDGYGREVNEPKAN